MSPQEVLQGWGERGWLAHPGKPSMAARVNGGVSKFVILRVDDEDSALGFDERGTAHAAE
jgi:hypothetical protein